MSKLLPQIKCPADLQTLSDEQLQALAQEIRDELVRVLTTPPGPLRQQPRRRRALPGPAPDLRLLPRPPDLGHRPPDLSPQADHRPATPACTRSGPRAGLMGFPNPAESPFDLFMTGHAGCSLSTALGLKVGDDLLGQHRPPRGRRHRRRRLALRHRLRGVQPRQRPEEEAAGHPERQQDVDLPARRRPGRLPRPRRMTGLYNDWNKRVEPALAHHPPGRRTGRSALEQFKTRSRPSSTTACSSRNWASSTSGPIDGHDLHGLRKILRDLKHADRSGVAPRPDQQGARLRAGRRGPGQVHTPPAVSASRAGPEGRAAQERRRPGLHRRRQRRAARGHAGRPQGRRDHRRHVRGEQAAEGPRDLPRRSSSTSASARATRWPSPPAWPRPACGRSSTSTARSSSAASTRSSRKSASRTCRSSSPSTAPAWSGPTVRRTTASFDLAYMRLFPNMVVHGPGRRGGRRPDARVRSRAPRAGLDALSQGEPRDGRPGRTPRRIELGKSEVISWGEDGCFIAYGTLLSNCVAAAKETQGRRFGHRRHQRPLRQAARHGKRSSRPWRRCRSW